MGLETGNRIEDLNSSWPLGTDNLSDSDGQHRLIKSCTKGSFPALGSTAVSTTAVELNSLDGISASSTVESRLAALEADASGAAPYAVMGGKKVSGTWDISSAVGSDWQRDMAVFNETPNVRVYWESSAPGGMSVDSLATDENGNLSSSVSTGSILGSSSVGDYFYITITVIGGAGGRDSSGTPTTDGIYKYQAKRSG